jgi:hypothetical protein
MSALIDTLRHITGAAHVLTDGDLSAWEQDWRKPRARQGAGRGAPRQHRRGGRRGQGLRRAAWPSCRRAATPGLSVGSVPDASGTQVVLSLRA